MLPPLDDTFLCTYPLCTDFSCVSLGLFFPNYEVRMRLTYIVTLSFKGALSYLFPDLIY